MHRYISEEESNSTATHQQQLIAAAHTRPAGDDSLHRVGRTARCSMTGALHRWVGAGEYGDDSYGKMCGDCGMDQGDVAAGGKSNHGDQKT